MTDRIIYIVIAENGHELYASFDKEDVKRKVEQQSGRSMVCRVVEDFESAHLKEISSLPAVPRFLIAERLSFLEEERLACRGEAAASMCSNLPCGRTRK